MRISDCSSDVCSSDLSHCRSRRRRFRVLTCLFSVWSSTRRSCNRSVTSVSNSVSDPACFMHAGGAIKTTTGVTIMSDIISELAGQFGIPSAQAESAAGSVLKFVQTEAGSGDFQKLLAAAPQIQGWIAKAGQGAASSGGGGLLGQLGGLAAGLGGGAGGIAGVLAALQQTGLKPELIAQFAPARSE